MRSFSPVPSCPILFRLAASSPVLFRITKSRRIWFHPSCSISFRPDPSCPLCHPILNGTVLPPTVPSSFIHSYHIPALPVLSRTTHSRPRTVCFLIPLSPTLSRPGQDCMELRRRTGWNLLVRSGIGLDWQEPIEGSMRSDGRRLDEWDARTIYKTGCDES